MTLQLCCCTRDSISQHTRPALRHKGMIRMKEALSRDISMRQKARKSKNHKESHHEGEATMSHEAELWAMTDTLRGSMGAAECRHVVLDLIFLKYISDAFDEQHGTVLEQWGSDTTEDRGEYFTENIFWVLPEVRWGQLKGCSKQSDVKPVAFRHIRNIFRDEEPHHKAACVKFAQIHLQKDREIARERNRSKSDIFMQSLHETQFHIRMPRILRENPICGRTANRRRLAENRFRFGTAGRERQP